MKGIAIYFEGGGDTAEGRAQLRRGMGEFVGVLRDKARARSLHWKLVACGSRDDAHGAFENGRAHEHDTFHVLLVDAEGPVSSAPVAHLRTRDRWPLESIEERQVHLMVETMETWLIADRGALTKFYGKDFQASALPDTEDLEKVPKFAVATALDKATARTQKGVYHKIKHASLLLERLDVGQVKARCPHARRLFAEMEAVLEE